MAALELDTVSRRFGGLLAVKDLSLTIRPGSITGLIGPNGAGKTTVVNLITGMLKLTGGTVRLGERDISRLQPDEVANLGIARTFQNVRLMKDASVRDNIFAGHFRHDPSNILGQLLRLPAVRRREMVFGENVDRILSRFRMTGKGRLLAGSLSYGDQRRLEIMRALAMEPKILILDEPVAGMNDKEAYDLGGQIRELADSGIGVLLIEHNMRFVMSLCEHLYVVSSGELISEGDPQAVASDPRVINAYLGD